MNHITSNLRTVINSYRRGESRSTIMPSIFVIEPTNRCNLNCAICPDKKNIKQGFMSINDFQQIILNIKHTAKAIYLHLHGEPLLHDRITDMVRFCKQNTDAKISLSTNAVLLNKNLAEEIANTGLDEIVFSLDAYKQKTFKELKKADLFNAANENIRYFLSVKGDGKPRVIIKMVLTQLNKNEVNRFTKEWSLYDCKVHVTKLSSWANQLEDYSCLSTDTPNYYLDSRTPCADLWFKMVVNYTGKVLLCCYDYEGKHIIGDLLKESVQNIWNNDYLQNIRQGHLNSNFGDIMCKSCLESCTEQDEYAHFEEFSLMPVGRP